MIDIAELRRIGRLKGITNLGYAEKDYFQEIVLLTLSRSGPRLVFKGGTALYKCYGIDRFSEDLDFSGTLDKGDAIVSALDAFGAHTERSTEEISAGAIITLKINGILYRGDARSQCKLQLHVNYKSSVILKPNRARIFSLYPDIPSFVIRTMQEKEILAEKVRALLTRDRARDMYDLWFLLRKGIPLDGELIENKLAYYNVKFDTGRFLQALREKEHGWKDELKPFVSDLPEYKSALRDVVDAFSGYI